MSERDSAWQVAQDAADVLAPEIELVADLDMASFGGSLIAVLNRAMEHPARLAEANLQLWANLARIGPFAVARAAGADMPPPLPTGRDKRFADPAWDDNPAFAALRQAYLAARQFSADLLAAGQGDQVSDGKAELAASFLLDACSPTNFLATNPAALKRAFDTGGTSLIAGARNFVDDLVHNHGRPRQVDTRPFVLGDNMAATPGKVVFSNDLMELIQYAPQTPEVHAIPMLASPPWINKYYIMDLAPGRSFIEWAIRSGHTMFAISYRNPDESMRGVTLDDYLIAGPKTALDVISDITGADKIDITGLCLGGALTAMLAAYLAAHRGPADRLGHPAEHHARLQRAGRARGVHRRADGGPARAPDGQAGLPGRQPDGRHLRHAPGQRPDLRLRGVQLADGQAPARLRHPGLERGQHPDARGDALLLPALPVYPQRTRPRRTGTRRPAAFAR